MNYKETISFPFQKHFQEKIKAIKAPIKLRALLGFFLLLLLFVWAPKLTIVVATIIFVYKKRLTSVRKEGWEEAVKEAQTQASFRPGSKTTGGLEEAWLFAGPPTNEKQNLHQTLSHYPGYLWSMLYLFFCRIPLFAWRILCNSVKAKSFRLKPEISDRQIYDAFIMTPFLVMAEMKDHCLEFTVPEMPLTSRKGLSPSGLHMVFNYKTQTIITAELRDENLLGENDKIAGLLIMALITWAHPQTHIVAEISAREIARKNIQELEPSNRFVVALHDGLIYGPSSPLAKEQFLSINIDKKSGLESSTKVRMSHNIDAQKMQFRYYNFLLKARASVHKNIRKFNLDVNPEFLFNNMVVHSVDHHFIYQNLNKIPYWSIDGGTSIISYFRSQMFISMWVHHVATPLEEEKIGKLSAKEYPFYNAVYRDVKEIDQELADCILASTSF